MSRDIRSFFTVISKKSGTDSSKKAAPVRKKQPKKLIDSDDEDIVAATPEQKKPTKKAIVLSSDSEDNATKKKNSNKPPEKKRSESPKKKQKSNKKAVLEILSSSDDEGPPSKKIHKESEKKKDEEPKLKPASVADIFKNTPITQSKVAPPKHVEATPEKGENKTKRKKKNDKSVEKKVHADLDFEKTLDDLDDYFEQNAEALERSVCEGLNEGDKKENGSTSENKETRNMEKKARLSDSENEDKKDEKKENVKYSDNEEKKNGRKRSRTDSTEKNTPKKKKIEHVDSGIDPGQEAHEKKRYSAMLYQKYLNRGTPKNQGLKELPKGKPDCLKNLCFLKTGVLDSLDSEGFNQLVKDHGGRTVQAISKKVDYMVVGEDPGPAKIAKAESYKIPSISEDELLDMILKKSGMEPKYCKGNTSLSSEDLGIDMDEIPTDKEEQPSKNKPEEKKETKTEQKKNVSPAKEAEKENKEVKKPVNKPTENTKTVENNGVKPSSFYSQPSTSKANLPQPKNQSSKKDTSMLPLTEKYKPQDLKAVIGQQDDKSNLYKLKNWLEKWHKNQDPKVKKTLIKPSPWAKCDDGAYFKCALLSGSPGVGKTTSATLVAKELGLDVVELNASDTRSKKSLQEEVSQLLQSKPITGFATGQGKLTNNRVLLMDEVDGMAGNEDRGGIQELIQLIKNSRVPIICMCNDRNHQKMRSLVNYCFDLKFAKPRLEQIRGAMMSICFKEKINISAPALSEIIAGTGCDVRQTLNHLSLLACTKEKITTEMAGKEAKSSKKDSVMGPWEVCRTVFTKSEHKNMSVVDKARLFFFDYSLGPLFVQENYLKVQPDGAKKNETLLKAALTAASLSTGDLIDSKIRRNNNWALLESEAFFCSVIPGHLMSGSFTSQINFPSWLGKNSKKNKFNRLINEIQMHTRTTTSANKMAIRLDYLVPLRNAILSPLQKDGLYGVQKAVDVMKDYKLLREDVDSLVELNSWVTKENPMNKIDTKVKTAFTKAYNKHVSALPYAHTSGISKKKAAAADNDFLNDEEEVPDESDNEKDDDIKNNSMIKVKKQVKTKKTDEEPNTSKKNQGKKRGGKKGKKD